MNQDRVRMLARDSDRSRATASKFRQSRPSSSGPSGSAHMRSNSASSQCQNSTCLKAQSGPCSRPGSASRSASASGLQFSRVGSLVASAVAYPNASCASVPGLDSGAPKLPRQSFAEARGLNCSRIEVSRKIQKELTEALPTSPCSSQGNSNSPWSGADSARRPPSRCSAGSCSAGSCPSSLRDELEQMGFSAVVAAATISRVGPGASVEDAISALCRDPNSPLEAFEKQWECQICFDAQGTYGWCCPEGHRFCRTCMRQHVKASATPLCPQPKCGFELDVADLRLLGVSRRRLDAFESNKLRRAIETLGAESNGECKVVHCRRDGCENVVVVPPLRCREEFACPCGAPSFCVQCGETPYHYHADCKQVPFLRRRWLEWVSEARASRKKHQEALLALQKRIETDNDLARDEEWKTRNCRMCPNCGRLVQKIDGCNAMKCGQDAHGGNRQSGCGLSFDWETAPSYVPGNCTDAVARRRKLEDISSGRFKVCHPDITCKVCENAIVGARLRCINCEDFNVCGDCEASLDDHDLAHVFEIITRSDFDWSGHLLPVGVLVRVVRSRFSTPPKWHGNQLEGKDADIIGVAKASGGEIQQLKGQYVTLGSEANNFSLHSESFIYRLRVKGHRGSDPVLPAEYLLPLVSSGWQAHCLLNGCWGKPEPRKDPAANFHKLVELHGVLVACRMLNGRVGY